MKNINKTIKELNELGFYTNDEIIEGLIFENNQYLENFDEIVKNN